MAMALIYRNPKNYLLPDEMFLYEKKLKEEQDKFKGIDVSGDYRIERIQGSFYVVGHNEISAPTYSFENALKLLIQKENSLRPLGEAEK
jgi:hypothetical protein